MKQRGWKKTVIISGIIAIALVLLFVAVPRLLDLNRYHHIIESKIEETLGGEVRLGRISWGLSNGIWLKVDGFFIRDARMLPGEADFSKIYAKVRVLPLLKKKIVVKRLLLQGSEVGLRIEESPPASSASHEPVAFEIEQLDITIDRLELDDTLTFFGREGIQVYWDIHVSAAPIVPGREIAFELSLGRSTRSNIEGLEARGTFSGLTEVYSVENPELELYARINSLDVNSVERYFSYPQLAEQLDGSISLEMNYEGDLVEHHRVGGLIDFNRVSYQNPDLFETTLPGDSATLTYRMELDSSDLTIEKLRLNLGGISLDATAAVQFFRDEDIVINSAEISSAARLADLMPYIPWPLLGDSSDAVRKMCMAGGGIELQNVLLSEIRLSEAAENPKDLLTKFRLTASFSDVSLPHLFFLPGVDKISGRMAFEKGVFLAEDIQALIGPMSLPTITVRATRIAREPKVSFRAKGPLRVAATGDEDIKEVLARYGLKNFYGLAEVELSADYGQRNSENWVADGLLTLKGVHVEALTLDAVMDDLRGEIALSRKEQFNMTVRDLTAAINRTPFRLSGDLTGIGTPEMLIDAEVFSENLDLAGLSKLVPALKAYDPGGRLDLDVDVRIPYASPAEGRVSGTLKARDAGFRIPDPGLRVDGANADITVAGNAAKIDTMHLLVNGQPVSMSGTLSGIGTPEMLIDVEVFSEGLDLAGLPKLIPALKAYDPGGRLDLDLDVHIPYATLSEGRISGNFKTRGAGFRIPGRGLTVDGANADITVAGNAAKIDTMNLLVNGQPVAFSGNLTGVGTSEMLVDGEVSSENLDLAALSKLVPVLEEYDMVGRLDLDLDVHIPGTALAESRISGNIKARGAGFLIPENNLTVDEANADITLKGNAATVDDTTLEINGQPVALSGVISDPAEPKVTLFLRSTEMDLDRILAEITSSGDDEMSPFARKLTADVRAFSGGVRYLGTQFQNVSLEFLYDHGVVEDYHLDAGLGGGTIEAEGSADFRNPGEIPVVLESDGYQLPAAIFLDLLGWDILSIDGPLTLEAHLSGHAGTIDEVLADLYGDLDVRTGKGAFIQEGVITNVLIQMVELASLKGFFKGRTIDNLNAEGLSFRSIDAETSFSGGTVTAEKIFMKGDAMNIEGRGTVDLVNRQLAMRAELIPLSIADSALDWVPIVGDITQSLTRIHLEITGSFDDPKVRVVQVKSVVKDVLEKPGEIIKDVENGLKKLAPGNKEEENQ